MKLYAPSSPDSQRPDLFGVEWEVFSGDRCVTFITSTSNPTTMRATAIGSAKIRCVATYYNKDLCLSSLPGKVQKIEYYTVSVVSDSDPNPDPDPDPDTGDGYFWAKNDDGIHIFYYYNSNYMTASVRQDLNGNACVNSNTSGIVRIPEYVNGYEVRYITNAAFHNLKNVTGIVMPKTIRYVDNYTTLSCPNIESITILNETPPTGIYSNIDVEMFDYIQYLNATLYVPKGTKSKYEVANGWKNFRKIVEIDEKIERITVSQFLSKADTKTKYELTGVVKNISNTASGNFDLEQNGSKVYINGTLDKDGNAQKWGSLGVSEGDSIVLQGVYTTYNSAPAIKNAQYISHRRNMTVNLSKAGYATFYDSKNSFDLPNGLTAKVVTGVSNGKLEYRSLSDNVVPAGVAVMISGNANGGTYTLSQSLSEGRFSGSNMLYGSDKTTMTSGDGYHYKLAYGHSGTSLSNVFGWYWGNDNGGAFKSEAHRAWLVAPKSTKTRSVSIEGETTEIVTVESDDTEDACYDLQGRRIKTPAKNGVYIINGKTRIVK